MGVKRLITNNNIDDKLRVDAFITFTYPDTTIFGTKQAMELGFTLKVFVINVGSCFEFYKNMFGKEKVLYKLINLLKR